LFRTIPWVLLAVIAVGQTVVAPAEAKQRRLADELAYDEAFDPDYGPYRQRRAAQEYPEDGEYDLAQEAQIAPSEAAAIAKSVVPGAKVVRVKLLPSGYYAVTLRAKGSVTRVMVSATDGSVN
jgi:hypothetical protein